MVELKKKKFFLNECSNTSGLHGTEDKAAEKSMDNTESKNDSKESKCRGFKNPWINLFCIYFSMYINMIY